MAFVYAYCFSDFLLFDMSLLLLIVTLPGGGGGGGGGGGVSIAYFHLSLVMRKLVFCIWENKDADQLRGADQRLCFRFTDSTIHLLSKFEISSF